MTQSKRTAAGENLTDLMLDIFRFTSAALAAGDKLVAPLGLTSARWQILGAIVAADRPQSVAWLARDLGASRQNVQRIVNDLHSNGHVDFETNPHHRRAQLVVLTAKGREAYDAAMEVQVPWINRLSEGLDPQDLEIVRRVFAAMRSSLQEGETGRDEV